MRTRRSLAALAFVTVTSVVAWAQGPIPATPPPPPALSEVEQLRVENLKLRTALAQTQAQSDACRAELGSLYGVLGQTRADRASQDLTAAEAQLKALVEKNHPGYTWNPKTGAFTPKPPES